MSLYCTVSCAGRTKLSTEPSWDAICSSLTESLSQMSNLMLEVVQPTWRPTPGGEGEKGKTTMHAQTATLTPHTTSYREQLVSVMASRGVSSLAPPPTAPPPSNSHQRQLDSAPMRRVPEDGSCEAAEGGSPPRTSPLERDHFKILLLNW